MGLTNFINSETYELLKGDPCSVDESSVKTYFQENTEKREKRLTMLVRGSSGAFNSILVQSALANIIGDVGTLASSTLIKYLGNQGALTNQVMQYVAAGLTIGPQMKMVMYKILTDNIKQQLSLRINLLLRLRSYLLSINGFLATYDISLINEREWEKLKDAALYVKNSVSGMKAVSDYMKEISKFNGAKYRYSQRELDSARTVLSSNYEFLGNGLKTYVDNYKRIILNDLVKFINNVLSAMALVPFPKLSVETFRKLSISYIDQKIVSFIDDISSKSFGDYISAPGKVQGFLVQNTNIRTLMEELSNFELTYKGLETLANTTKSDVEEKYNLLKNLYDDILKTLYPNPSDLTERLNTVELSMKNALFLNEITIIGQRLAFINPGEEYQDISEDLDKALSVIALAKDYPEKHLAEEVVEDMLKAFIPIMKGIFSANGSAAARNLVSNLIRKIDKALKYDRLLISEMENYFVMDNELYKAANLLFNSNLQVLEDLNMSDLKKPLLAGNFSKIFSSINLNNSNSNLNTKCKRTGVSKNLKYHGESSIPGSAVSENTLSSHISKLSIETNIEKSVTDPVDAATEFEDAIEVFPENIKRQEVNFFG